MANRPLLADSCPQTSPSARCIRRTINPAALTKASRLKPLPQKCQREPSAPQIGGAERSITDFRAKADLIPATPGMQVRVWVRKAW